ncbi:MAG TPA: coproporphyrinogen dehydrogenase HemZ, partial [Candidatus Avimonas sp.]|nr:coproporphyrinogen dehydrogenase HemZ [Candidatus Avimonas sp.]
ERKLSVQLYRLFVKHYGFTLSWGAITGVRPVKLLRQFAAEIGREKAAEWFKDELLVSDEKISLCLDILNIENEIIALSRPESFSLYISIPFCPSRCDYCSFVSHTVEKAARLIPLYIENLCKEIEYTGAVSRELGLRLETVYIGGGTPTSISAEQLGLVLDAINRSFDLSNLREFTVEAGRPDTITEDKLRVIKSHDVGRISINPQTLNDNVLAAIGRRHTAQDYYNAFNLASKIGFGNINTDLIAGLPEDDIDSFNQSLEGVISLSPESVTVHTLAFKKSSNLVTKNRVSFEKGRQAAKMIDSSIIRLKESGYRPYYLYRQSKTVGGTENTGWAKPGFEGLYNVYIMDETHTILACGAGAVTKLCRPHDGFIERIFNFKFPYEYNSRFDEIILRKGRVKLFYEGC